MADYEIDVPILEKSKTSLGELKDTVNKIGESYTSTTIKEAKEGYDAIASKITNNMERLTKGYTNSYTWLTGYTTDLNTLEESLKGLDLATLIKPIEFKGTFEDIFGKITMPAIKTGGDPNCNAKMGPSILGNTQASSFYELGDKAYNEYGDFTDDCARAEWIKKVGEIVKNTNTYGMKKSLIIAQIINESGWMSSHASTLSDYNNVLGINTDMGRITPDMQDSAWSKKQTSGDNDVTQWSADGSHIVGTNEKMRHYDSIEECIEDYSNVLYLYHPECKGSNNLEDYRSFLESYTPNPHQSTTDKYAGIISKYNLERFDE